MTQPTLRITGFLALAIVLATASPASENASQRGAVSGGAGHVIPDWFKSSFLDIREDVDEATESGKHVMLFFDLNDCPYCERMLAESFGADPFMSFIREHFDVIAINVQGDREVAFNEEVGVSEKALAELLNVRGTPAILFLDRHNKPVVRVDGYRAPARLQQVLSYVSSKSYRTMSLANYVERHAPADVYVLRDHALFREIRDLSAVRGPLALIFEDRGCHDCAEFHERLLSRADVKEVLREFTVVRLDTHSPGEIIAPAGNATTARELARHFDMTYRPGVLLFDDGKLVRRHDSLLYVFHFTESLRYVAGGFHKTLDYEAFKEQHREALLSRGIDIDFAQ